MTERTKANSSRKRRGNSRPKGGRSGNLLVDNGKTATVKDGPIRESLFPNVPPYIRFTDMNHSKPLPRTIRRLLRWKCTKCTPWVVRNVVRRSGYLVINEDEAEDGKQTRGWSGSWSNNLKSHQYRTLCLYQKMNHLPGTGQIGRKDNLWRHIQFMKNRFGERNFDIMPTTYVLPQDKNIFRIRCGYEKLGQCWIIKPPACYRGDGIKIIQKYQQVPKKEPVIVQRYIQNPSLIDGKKFDLRLYALLTSVHPLRLYLYEEGLVRFATVKYNPDLRQSLNDEYRYMHLTNYSINKFNKDYETNSDTEACKGHKWTLRSLWRYLNQTSGVEKGSASGNGNIPLAPADVDQLWNSLVDLVVRTFISGEGALFNRCEKSVRSKYNNYELFGLDVIFDTFWKPWLLEVNILPSLESTSRLDETVKAHLVRDTFNVCGFHIPSSKTFTDSELLSHLRDECGITFDVAEPIVTHDARIYTSKLSETEIAKQKQFANVEAPTSGPTTFKRPVTMSRFDYLDKILEDLTPDDLRTLIIAEDEANECGAYQRVFPTHETYKYMKYFQQPRYYNMLLDAWEAKYYNKREEGRNILRKHCQEGDHLIVATSGNGIHKKLSMRDSGATT